MAWGPSDDWVSRENGGEQGTVSLTLRHSQSPSDPPGSAGTTWSVGSQDRAPPGSFRVVSSPVFLQTAAMESSQLESERLIDPETVPSVSYCDCVSSDLLPFPKCQLATESNS